MQSWGAGARWAQPYPVDRPVPGGVGSPAVEPARPNGMRS